MKILCFITVVLLLLPLLLCANVFSQNPENDFFAYYTKLPDFFGALEMVHDKLFGKYCDVVVKIGDKGNLLFSLKTSYLPIWACGEKEWRFEEICQRKGDGKSDRPDIISKYSHVRVIKNTASEIIVHWRYFPDFNYVEWDGVVDEYFFIKPDGKVFRTTKKGTKKIDDWNNNVSLVKKSYLLNETGIFEDETYSESSRNISQHKPIDSPVIKVNKPDPALNIRFDEGIRSQSSEIIEDVSGKEYQVKGLKTLWKKGISGSALQFDGYYSSVEIDNPFKQDSIKELTVECWIAPGAYPFDWAPVVHQAKWDLQGFYLGINENGFLGFHFGQEEEWINIVDTKKLNLYEWHHIAAVYKTNLDKVSLYVNGESRVVNNIQSKNLVLTDNNIIIGKNSEKMPVSEDRIGIGKWPSMFGFDGLIDELCIYNKALSADEIKNLYLELKLADSLKIKADMQVRKFPQLATKKENEKFEARYTKLKYYETWDNLWRVSEHADIVVSFDKFPINIVFWRGESYGPYFVSENGKWIGDQSNEDYRLLEHPGEAEGCLAHMSDKQCRHSHVRIIENTDARIIIHWRYGLVDSRYLFAPGVDGWGGWTDEYWTIYPDGVALRHVPRGIVFGDGWVETMFFSEPGTKPEDNCELEAITILTENGKKSILSWEKEPPHGVFENVQITMVNSKSKYRMFNIFPTGSSVEVFSGHNPKSHFHWWNHWPVSQITSDGRGAKEADRAAHSSLIWGAPEGNFLLYGMTDKPAEDLRQLANSWDKPPEIKNLEGASEAGYIKTERAYHIKMQKKKLTFRIDADKNSLLVNPSFVLHNWNIDKFQLKINGESFESGKKVRYGFTNSAEGKNLIVWLEYESNKNTKFEFFQ
jgi:hypothetical protein